MHVSAHFGFLIVGAKFRIKYNIIFSIDLKLCILNMSVQVKALYPNNCGSQNMFSLP
jgi:hypothetical protein